MTRRRSFVLDAKALDTARASSVLALDPRAIGRSYSLLGEAAPVEAEPAATADKVAIVGVMGPLAQRAEEFLCGFSDGYDAITARFASAVADPEVGAIVLLIDSPGGDVAGLFSAVSRMRAMRDQSKKPVYAYADELAASAAYALATVADAGIYLPTSGEVGSIGTLAVHAEESRALANEGVTVTVFRSGARKAEVNSLEPLTDAARARVQGQIDQLAGQFAERVAEARGLSRDGVLALEGAVFMGQAAVEAGLADGVASLEDVIAMAAAAAAEKIGMKEIAKTVGLPADAKPDDVRAKVEEMAKLAELGRALAPVVGADPAKAAGLVGAWKQSHETAETERAARVAEKKAAEGAERIELLAKLVVSGWETPATAWEDPTADERKPKGSLATMPIAELRARVETLCAQPRAFSKEEKPALRADGLTARELAKCKAKGIDPIKYAETKRRMRGADATSSEV